ncbi:ATP-binding protein [Niabella pedocola]|uniref:histidine kinase n=1 Tax=Niabella pedocola TaxID=1752077 RepID=A0ABS8PUT8_9BACT|nr:tetratricopeptide repeat-containing sensor histidine kinase [Niabella pedocola]MCD2424829.1 ATP-binding protein [Niabella pedocola]
MNYLKPLLFLFISAIFSGCNTPPKAKPVPPSTDFQKATNFIKTNKDSAFYYFNKVATSPGDSLLIGRAYANMAILLSKAADPFGSQETSLQALKFLNEKKYSDRRALSSVYNELAYTNITLRKYETSLGYSNHALKFAKDSDRITALNNKALAYQRLRQYEQALSIYQSILEESKNNPAEYARVLTNMANTKRLRDSTYNPLPELRAALQVRESNKDASGLSASYAHLSDYYARSRPDSALFYANKMYLLTQQPANPGDELLALRKLITFGPPELIKGYFNRYRFLNDSMQTSRNTDKNQFALIRYETEKSKADNLVLQKDNAEKKVQIVGQWILLLSILVLTITGFWWYRKQKQRAIREQQLRTSQKVHDVVANGLYHVISKVDHDKTGGKEQLLDDLTHLYEQSRNISYEQPEEKAPLPFNESLAALLSSFSSADTRVLIVGNSKELWSAVKPGIKKELTQILQELMVNMKKHSRAGNVVIRFLLQQKTLTVQYTDDGVGAAPDFRYGNGLRNTESRIAGMGGRISFDTETSEGMKIQLYIPTA